MSRRSRRSLEDILGEVEAEEAAAEGQPTMLLDGGFVTAAGDIDLDLPTVITTGVSIKWLTAVLGTTTQSVRGRLAGCKPMHRERGVNYYELKVAMQYLVEPKMDLPTLMSDVKVKDFPPRFQRDYWESRLKMQRWQAKAAQLWDTSAVMEVFSDTALSIKTTIALWSDMIDQKKNVGPCTREQLDELQRLSEGLQRTIYADLCEMPGTKSTMNTLGIEFEAHEKDIDHNAEHRSDGKRGAT